MKNKLDRYFTPNELITSLDIDFDENDVLYEPCVGIGQVPANIPGNWETNDIVDGFDATKAEYWDEVDWTITNPPFNNALPILENALKHSKKGVAFLVRLSFLEPTKDRYEFFKNNPPTKMQFCPRPVFLIEKDGIDEDKRFRYNYEFSRFHDSVSCVWLIWEKGQDTLNVSWVKKPKNYTWEV